MSYQDVLDAQGQVAQVGTRDCAGRWQAIHAHLGDREGFTALDLGAYAGYFSLRLVEEHDADVVAVDNYAGLREVGTHPQILVIDHRLDVNQVADLGAFDVGLALSVLHHITEWRQMLDVLTAHCSTLFVEVPNPTEVLPKAIAHDPDMEATVAELGGTMIAETPGHRSVIPRHMWVIE